MRYFRRRDLLKAVALTAFSGSAFGGYAVAESFRQRVTRYAISPPGWTPGLNLKLAVIADIHACDPWMSAERVDEIVAQTNNLGVDAMLLLGDYVAGSRISRFATPVSVGSWATALSKLKAPLGVHAVLGNHDWWSDKDAQRRRSGPTAAGRALEAVGIPVYENKAVRLEKDGKAFWIAGLADQWAFYPVPENREFFPKHRRGDYQGLDDLDGTLAQVTDNAPVVLLAHEPDIFPTVPDRVALTVAGHTHGGQIRIFGYAPIVPSHYGSRYAYGHIVEGGRNLVVSAGLGCSGLPVRLGAEPEIVVLELSAGVQS